MTKLAHLFSPVTLGNSIVRNRIVLGAHGAGYAENGVPSDRYLRYFETRAKGGVGLIVMEAPAMLSDSVIYPRVFMHGWRDEIIPWYHKISEVVHAHGAKIFSQVTHTGRQGSGYYTWSPLKSCSDIPCPCVGEVPEVLDEEGIKTVVRQYVDIALRVKEGGFDGVELHFTHGYLAQQFLSPHTNIRKDNYGGSLENRMRFGMEIIDAVRKAVGDDFVVGLRATADEFVPEGLSLEDMKQVMPIWAQTGKIDYLNVSLGTNRAGACIVAPMRFPLRPFVYLAAEVKRLVDIPVFAAIRINDPVIANDIIKNYEADMVAMTRALICDPELPNKAREGRLDDIRICISCNEGCFERSAANQDPMTCLQNPEAGREGVFQIRPTVNPKKIIVIGGGCSGMEAAVIAKQRGHQVALYEKGEELGGAVLVHAKAPSREEMREAVRYLTHEVKRLGIEVHLNTNVTAALVEQENPDAVIVATGATTIEHPGPDIVGPDAAIEIEEGTHVVTAEDVLKGEAETGQRVVIADRQIYIKGLITAEVLADRGKEVTLIMPFPMRFRGSGAYEVEPATYGLQLLNLKTKKVKLISDCEVKKAKPGKIIIRDLFTEEEEELEANTLVLSYWRKAETKLYEELKGKVKELHKIGDCLAPRRLINAIYDAYKLAMEI